MSLQTKITENFSLGFGQGGDLLFLIYGMKALDKGKVSPWTLEKMAKGIFKEILLSDNNVTMSYWRGVVGLVQLFEVIDQNGLVDIDLNKVLREFDSNLLKYLISIDDPSNENLLIINTLLSRLRHYKETDSIYQKAHFLCVKNIESIFRFFDNPEIDIYSDDIAMKIDFLRKMFQMGLYKLPLVKLAKKIGHFTKGQLYCGSHTFDFVNNVLSIREYLISTGGDKSIITSLNGKLCNSNYFELDFESHISNGITPSYLSLMNKLIYFNKCFTIPDVDTFIKSRLTFDTKSSIKNGMSKGIDRGIIGTPGVSLTAISYLYPHISSWNNILMLS